MNELTFPERHCSVNCEMSLASSRLAVFPVDNAHSNREGRSMNAFFEMWAAAFDSLISSLADTLGDLFRLS